MGTKCTQPCIWCPVTVNELNNIEHIKRYSDFNNWRKMEEYYKKKHTELKGIVRSPIFSILVDSMFDIIPDISLHCTMRLSEKIVVLFYSLNMKEEFLNLIEKEIGIKFKEDKFSKKKKFLFSSCRMQKKFLKN